jgi:hypothetical protein
MSFKGSLVFREILTITTIWGICSSLDSQPKKPQEMTFGHSFDTAKKQARPQPQSPALEANASFDTRQRRRGYRCLTSSTTATDQRNAQPPDQTNHLETDAVVMAAWVFRTAHATSPKPPE